MRTALDDLRTGLTRAGFAALNRVAVPMVKAGIGAPPPFGIGLVVLETTGRTSGLPREVPLLASRCDRRISVSTVRSSSQWVRNLQAQPNASVWVGGRRRDVTSSVEPGALSVANLVVE